MSWTLGIDEAGRGPVLGPLVLCGVFVQRVRLRELDALGVRDSKSYGAGARARARRGALAQQIRALGRVAIAIADPAEIDRYTVDGGLNRLEQRLASELIDAGPPCEAIWADGARLFAPLRARFPALKAEDKADRNHAVVAAASIVAKVERDERLLALFSALVDDPHSVKGGGYPNAATAEFLRRYVARHGALPAGIRRSWSWKVLRELDAPSSCPEAISEEGA